jgi:type VI secretion system protein ImpA
MLAFETLTHPVSADDPCGPDLDSEGNVQYLNFFAGAEPLLPMSYFEVIKASGERGRFDPKAIDFEAQFEAAKPLLARTRDLRLTVLLAKLSVLNRDLDGFSKCLNAIAFLLQEQWDAVHPRGEGGDFSYRAVTIEAIDVLPTVINPLQFLPLIENRRYGVLHYRAYQVAKGEISGGDEAELDLATIERIVNEADLDVLRAASTRFADLVAVIARIKTTWRDKSAAGETLGLDRLSGLTGAIATWLGDIVRSRDPNAVDASPQPEAGFDEDNPASGSATRQAADGPKITSPAMAAAALTAVAGYFARSEPSNPALLLVRQAQEMVGKSFIEVMRMMVPAHVEAATINIGRDRFFDLPIERMAALLASDPPPPAEDDGGESIVFTAENRGQALILLGQIAGFFRTSEPSSPIPFLTDRARELAQRDFLSLLHDILPQGALKTIDNQG